MKLDKRITDVKTIMNCFTTDEAKKYVDKYGYFTDNIEECKTLGDLPYGLLVDIEDDSAYPYLFTKGKYTDSYKFFLPKEFVNTPKSKEKKYRPFTINEFEDFAVAQIYFRSKCKKVTYSVRYNGTVKYEDTKNIYVILGKNEYDLNTLLDEYEVMINNKWQPFGVEE